MQYALWNLDTGNRIGWYDDEEAALAEVRAAVAQFGRGYALPWALARHAGDDTEAIAEGAALIDRAYGVPARDAR